MRIINLNQLSGTAITVDSTLYTVDSTQITVDRTSIGDGEMTFKIVPRRYVDEVVLSWYHELKETTETENCFPREENGFLIVPYTKRDIVEGDSFEITMKDTSGNLLIRFQAYATIQEDLQNYKLYVPNNNGVIKF